VASRTNIRKVEIDHDTAAIVKLNPLAEWTEDEVDYVPRARRPDHSLYDQGLLRRSAAPGTRKIARRRPSRAGSVVVGVERTEECGIHCAVEGAARTRAAGAIGDRRERGRAARRGRRCRAGRGAGRLSMVQDGEPAQPLAGPRRGDRRGEVDGATRNRSRNCWSSLQTGRCARSMALARDGGAVRLPQAARAVAMRRAARARDEALKASRGRPLEKVSVQAAAPGEYIVGTVADGIQLSVRLGRNARAIGTSRMTY